MKRTVLPLYYGGHMMRWAKTTLLENPKGLVFLPTIDGTDPDTGKMVPGMEAQQKMLLQKMKKYLDEAGSGLEYICDMTWYIVGKFPNGIEQYPPFMIAESVFNDFFERECGAAPIPVAAMPEYKTFVATGKEMPLVIGLIGTPGLAIKDALVAMTCTAVIP